MRLFEWVLTLALIGMGTVCLFWPDAIAQSAFRYVLLFIPPAVLTAAYLIVGIARLVALIVNGHSRRWGPYVRGVCAIVSAIIWAQMCVALMMLVHFEGKPPSPGIPLYFAILCGEMFTTLRAMSEVRKCAKHRGAPPLLPDGTLHCLS